MKAHLLFLHALSPLHAGTGQGVGVIDLPIAREKATELPYVPGSTLKGVLRDNAGDTNVATRVFGAAAGKDEDMDYSGSLQVSDVRLLLLPVRSLLGTFAWVTSPFVLQRLARDVKDAGLASLPPAAPAVADIKMALVAAEQSALVKPGPTPKVFLEDLDFTARPDAGVTAWLTWLAPLVFPNNMDWQTMLKGRFCIVHDDAFHFLLETATEIIARIRLDQDKKTVAKGGLWYEEALPAETILAGLAGVRPVQASLQEVELMLNGLKGQVLQVGGKATVGRGLCKIQVH
jgi:CRISPR-associated protein Cmr4